MGIDNELAHAVVVADPPPIPLAAMPQEPAACPHGAGSSISCAYCRSNAVAAARAV
jgi:hypothetical protein